MTLDGKPVTDFGSDKARALLAYLAIESSHPHRRTALTGLFWPDLPEKKAAHNLSQTLLRLRRAFSGGLNDDDTPGDPPILLITNQEVLFNPLGNYRLDVATFLDLLKARRLHHPQHPADSATCPKCMDWQRQAVALYTGDLLAGFFLRENQVFEEWRLVQQEALLMQAIEAFEHLVNYHEQRGEYDQVQGYSHRLITLDPWNEGAHLQLMRALAARGHSVSALGHYMDYRRTLALDLGIEPSEEVTSFYHHLRMGVVPGMMERGTSGDSGLPLILPERRQITTLICGRNSKGSNKDPEDLYHQVRGCRGPCAAILKRYGGYLLPKQGEDCVAYFGYPQAYEDAAWRAVCAGLALAAVDPGDPVAVGIHTSLTIMGEKRGRRSQDRELVGEAPGVARACQRQAQPGTVWISEQTGRLVGKWFNYQKSETAIQKNEADENLFYRVMEEINPAAPFAWLDRVSLQHRLIGREKELQHLSTCLHQVATGQGKMVLVRGEPGIGKSRLIWELKRSAQLLDEDFQENGKKAGLWLETRCTPYHQNISLYPIVNLFEQVVGIETGDDTRVRQEKLANLLTQYPLKNRDAERLLSDLLGSSLEGASSRTTLTQHQEAINAIVVELNQKLRDGRPLVLVLEDLQWIDPVSILWLSHALDMLTHTPFLVLLTARTTFNPPWLPKESLTILDLEPLSTSQAEALILEIAENYALPPGAVDNIVAESDGIPLFLEEQTASLLASLIAHQRLPDELSAADPAPTLRDHLAARLDNLGPAKETAQWASVLGRKFSLAVLQAIVPFDQDRLQRDLNQMLTTNMIYPLDPFPHQEYAFRYALMQQAAYTSLLKYTRQEIHHQVVETLIKNFPKIVQNQPDLIDYHRSRADKA